MQVRIMLTSAAILAVCGGEAYARTASKATAVLEGMIVTAQERGFRLMSTTDTMCGVLFRQTAPSMKYAADSEYFANSCRSAGAFAFQPRGDLPIGLNNDSQIKAVPHELVSALKTREPRPLVPQVASRMGSAAFTSPLSVHLDKE